MMQLIGQMLLCLLLAFLLGLFLGWLLWARSCRKHVKDLEASYRDRLSTCERSLRSARTEISGLKSRPAAEAAVASQAPMTLKAEAPVAPAAAPVVAAVTAPAAASGSHRDNLKKVEGIGPKIEQLLNDDGIFTWAQLAATTVETIQGILRRAGDRFRMHDPATWPDQAKLLAEGRLEELKKFQDFLKGGRAV